MRREGETLEADRPRPKAKVEKGGRDNLRTLLNPISATQKRPLGLDSLPPREPCDLGEPQRRGEIL